MHFIVFGVCTYQQTSGCETASAALLFSLHTRVALYWTISLPLDGQYATYASVGGDRTGRVKLYVSECFRSRFLWMLTRADA
jgi:hypothetical protein